MSIIQQIVAGFENKKFRVIEDRKEAIEQALAMAVHDDIVLIAGKGHETYQIIADRKIDFDERAMIQEYFDAYPARY